MEMIDEIIQKKWLSSFGLWYLKVSTLYVVKSPVLGLQQAPGNSELAPSVKFSLTYLNEISLEFNSG